MLNTARVKTSGSGECNGGHSDEPENSEIAAGSTVAESPVMLNPKTPSCEGCPSNRVVPSINLCGFLETACSQDPFAKSQFQQRSDSTVQAVMLCIAKVKTSGFGECNGGHPQSPRVKQVHQLVYTGVQETKTIHQPNSLILRQAGGKQRSLLKLVEIEELQRKND